MKEGGSIEPKKYRQKYLLADVLADYYFLNSLFFELKSNFSNPSLTAIFQSIKFT